MTNTEWFLLKITAAYATLVHYEPNTILSAALVSAVVIVAFEIGRGIGHKFERANELEGE